MSDPEKSVMDKNLLGMWAHEKEAIVFLPHDKRTYTLLAMTKTDDGKWAVDSDDTGAQVYKAFITDVKNDRYLNIQFMPASLVYNPGQMNQKDLDALASAMSDIGKEGSAAVGKQRKAISKQHAKVTGIAPAFLIGKITLKGNQLRMKMFKTPDKDKQKYNALKSMDEVRAYVLKHPNSFEEEKVYTFVNVVREKNAK